MRIETIEPKVEKALKITGAVLLEGKAGSGKTSLLEYLAQKNRWASVFYQVHPKTSAEELLYQMLPDEESPSGITLVPGVLVKALQSAVERPTLLILDEWDKSRPSLDAFVLDFLQNRRISVPNFEVELPKEKWDNLMVGFTSNGEREMSEPFLRRVAVFRTSPLHPRDVFNLLAVKHRGNPYLASAVKLYVLTHYLDLPKPATIQELDQLLTAIELDPEEDWNFLVYTYVTKTPEMHELLVEGEVELKKGLDEMIEKVWGGGSEIPSTKASLYSATEEDLEVLKASGIWKDSPKLPRPFKVETESLEEEEIDLEGSTFVARIKDAEHYEAVVSILFDDDPSRFSQVGKTVVSKRTFSLDDPETERRMRELVEKLEELEEVGRIEGEILLTFDCSGLSRDAIFETLKDRGYRLGKLTEDGAVFVYTIEGKGGREDHVAEVFVKDINTPSPSVEAVTKLYPWAIEGFIDAGRELMEKREREKVLHKLGENRPSVLVTEKNKMAEVLDDNPLLEVTNDKARKEVLRFLKELPFEEESKRIKEGIEFATEFILKNEGNLKEKLMEFMDGWQNSEGDRARNQELLYRGLTSLLGPHFLRPVSPDLSLKESPLLQYYAWADKDFYPYESALGRIGGLAHAKRMGLNSPLFFHLAYLSWASYLLSKENTMKKLYDALSEKGRKELTSIPDALHGKGIPHDLCLYSPYFGLESSDDEFEFSRGYFRVSYRGVAYPVVDYVIDYVIHTGKKNVDFSTYRRFPEAVEDEDLGYFRTASKATPYVENEFVGEVRGRNGQFYYEHPPMFFLVLFKERGSDEEGFLYVASPFTFVLELSEVGKYVKGFQGAWEKLVETLSPYVESEPSRSDLRYGDAVARLTLKGKKIEELGKELSRDPFGSFKKPGSNADLVRAIEFANTVRLTKNVAEGLSIENFLEGVRFKLPEELAKYYTKDFFKEYGDLILVEKGESPKRAVAVGR